MFSIEVLFHLSFFWEARKQLPRSSQWTHCLRMWSSILWHCSSFFISMRLKEASLLSAFRCADAGSFGRSRNWINGTGIKRRAERSGFKRWEGLWIWTCRRSLSKMERLLVWDRKNKICGMAYSLLHWSIFVLVLCWNFVVAASSPLRISIASPRISVARLYSPEKERSYIPWTPGTWRLDLLLAGFHVKFRGCSSCSICSVMQGSH